MLKALEELIKPKKYVALKSVVFNLLISVALICYTFIFYQIFLLQNLLANLSSFIILYSIAFIFYATVAVLIIKHKPTFLVYVLALVLVGFIANRLLTMSPKLTSDFYRYIWDGKVTSFKENPYFVKPTDPESDKFNLDQNLLSEMKWKDQDTVYPPFAQLLFRLVYETYSKYADFTSAISKAKAWWVLPYIAVVTYAFLLLDPKLALILSLNPLLIFETFYGAHIDVWMTAFLMGSIYLYKKDKLLSSSLLLSFAVLTKIPAVIFAPFLFFDLLKKKKLKIVIAYFAVFVTVVGAMYIPFLQGTVVPIERYFSWIKTFEFNATIYRYLYVFLAEYSQDPKALAGQICLLIFTVATTLLSIKGYRAARMLFVGVLFLLLSPIFLPWYMIFLLPFAFLEVEGYSTRRKYSWLVFITTLQLLFSLSYVAEATNVTENTKSVINNWTSDLGILMIGAFAVLNSLRNHIKVKYVKPAE